MNSFSRSIFARSLMTGAASLAVMTMGPAGVRAEIVIVQGDDGAAGVIRRCQPGERRACGRQRGQRAPDHRPTQYSYGVAAEMAAKAGVAARGNGGNGGAASATAATTVISGSAEADASSGGDGGPGGRLERLLRLVRVNGGAGGGRRPHRGFRRLRHGPFIGGGGRGGGGEAAVTPLVAGEGGIGGAVAQPYGGLTWLRRRASSASAAWRYRRSYVHMAGAGLAVPPNGGQ